MCRNFFASYAYNFANLIFEVMYCSWMTNYFLMVINWEYKWYLFSIDGLVDTNVINVIFYMMIGMLGIVSME